MGLQVIESGPAYFQQETTCFEFNGNLKPKFSLFHIMR